MNTGENFKRRRKNTRNTDLRFSVGQVTAKPVYIATRKPEGTKLMKKKKRMRDKVEYIAKIEINMPITIGFFFMGTD
jgi:hypothetical protein